MKHLVFACVLIAATVFAGRRFQALNGLFIEPKAGGTFGSVELDDNDADQTFQDGLGTEFALTVGYVL